MNSNILFYVIYTTKEDTSIICDLWTL